MIPFGQKLINSTLSDPFLLGPGSFSGEISLLSFRRIYTPVVSSSLPLSDTHRGQAVRSRPSFEMYGEVTLPKEVECMDGWWATKKPPKIGKSKVG